MRRALVAWMASAAGWAVVTFPAEAGADVSRCFGEGMSLAETKACLWEELVQPYIDKPVVGQEEAPAARALNEQMGKAYRLIVGEGDEEPPELNAWAIYLRNNMWTRSGHEHPDNTGIGFSQRVQTTDEGKKVLMEDDPWFVPSAQRAAALRAMQRARTSDPASIDAAILSMRIFLNSQPHTIRPVVTAVRSSVLGSLEAPFHQAFLFVSYSLELSDWPKPVRKYLVISLDDDARSGELAEPGRHMFSMIAIVETPHGKFPYWGSFWRRYPSGPDGAVSLTPRAIVQNCRECHATGPIVLSELDQVLGVGQRGQFGEEPETAPSPEYAQSLSDFATLRAQLESDRTVRVIGYTQPQVALGEGARLGEFLETAECLEARGAQLDRKALAGAMRCANCHDGRRHGTLMVSPMAELNVWPAFISHERMPPRRLESVSRPLLIACLKEKFYWDLKSKLVD